MNTRLVPMKLERNGLAVDSDGTSALWYPILNLGQIPEPLFREMQTRLAAHEQMYNALLLVRLSPTIHRFLQKHDPKALEQVEAAISAATDGRAS